MESFIWFWSFSVRWPKGFSAQSGINTLTCFWVHFTWFLTILCCPGLICAFSMHWSITRMPLMGSDIEDNYVTEDGYRAVSMNKYELCEKLLNMLQIYSWNDFLQYRNSKYEEGWYAFYFHIWIYRENVICNPFKTKCKFFVKKCYSQILLVRI